MCGESQDPIVFWSMFVKSFPFLVFMRVTEGMANREDVVELPKDGETAQPVTPARGRLRTLAPFLVFAGLFAAALTGSWQVRNQFTHHEEEPAAKAEPPTPSPRKAEHADSAAEILEGGDQALAMHRFARAISHYEELLKRHPDSAALVAYRLGLCNESLGDLDKAHAAYRRAVSAAPIPALTLAAHLGMARCLLRDRHPADARRLLSAFLLDEARQQDVPEPLRAGMRYLVALALAQESWDAARTLKEDDGFVSVNAASLEIPFYFDEITASSRARQEMAVETFAPPLSLKNQLNPVETIVLRVDQSDQPVVPLLDNLVTQAGLATEWTDEARKHLETRSLRLALRNWPLMDLLDHVADRFDLIVELDDDVIRFSRAARADVKHDAMKRALRAALLADGNHPWAPAALLELGNAEAVHGKSTKAAIWYERLMRNAPASSQVAPACFNLALLHARNHELALARQTWFRVIDHVPGHELALRAYLHIGQSYLEEENPAEAIVQLRRAQRQAPGSRYRPVATLLLAAAHLQQDEPADARLALAKYRIDVMKEPNRPTAMFLDAYAAYRLAKSAGGGRREASELLDSLWLVVDDNQLGPFGDGLIARAYLDLGFGEQAEQRLRKTLAKTRGPYVPLLEFSLGETLLARERRADAVVIFQKLAADPSPHRTKAKFKLAQFDLQDKNYAACEEKCRQIWAEKSFAEPAALLQVWGSALESMGEFTKAASCFAGKAPE
jgi:tetratricopeptide (TPR) repeat protein